MLSLIRDLYAHQAWADAEMWRFLQSSPAALVDKRVMELLNHIHAVQRFFLSAVQGEPLTREELAVEMPASDLLLSYRQYHLKAESYLGKMREAHLNDKVTVPWFPDFRPTSTEALLQAVMHTVHHRGQILMLARQLGADPKPVDFIIWTAKGRPEPKWDVAASAS
ncbi:MAG TPA: DinB family protein [Terriglobales bacterium]|nr:DinB family protein [Terriglobales bacterium]